MLIRLGDIEGEPLELERSFELPTLVGGEGERLVPGRVHFRGEMRRGSAGVELRGRWEVTLRLECSRCLDAFDLALGEDFFLILTPAAAEFGASEQEMQTEDAALFYVEGEQADLAQIAAEQILLSVPLKPICRPDCAGLCPTCGVNRNRIECGCRRDEVDPRLAPLLEWKERFGKGPAPVRGAPSGSTGNDDDGEPEA